MAIINNPIDKMQSLLFVSLPLYQAAFPYLWVCAPSYWIKRTLEGMLLSRLIYSTLLTPRLDFSY